MPDINDPTPIDVRSDIEWSSGYVWVQKSAWLKMADGDASPSNVRVMRHDGVRFEIPQSTLAEAYMEVEEGRLWKPKYRPLKAFPAKTELDVRLPNGHSASLNPGDAIIKKHAEEFIVVRRDRYLSEYQVIGFPGTRRPLMPFQPDLA